MGSVAPLRPPLAGAVKARVYRADLALGLTLLTAFSAGLAVVLTAVGLAVLYAKQWLPDSSRLGRSKAMRYLPVASAACIVCVGIAMTWVSLRPAH